jgi:hypothetical protein
VSAPAAQRFTREQPCPICGGHDGAARGQGQRCFGYLDSTGEYARCTREELAGELAINADETFSHRLSGLCRCGVEHGPSAGAVDEAVRHTIRGLDGAPIAVHGRRGSGQGKRVWWERPDGSPGLNGTRPAEMLYGLERLEEAPDSAAVFLVEGEPAADALARLGCTALGTVTGAGTETAPHSIAPSVAAHLAGRSVYLFPDADEAGRAHMAANARVLGAAGAQVHVLDWPEAPTRGDAVDLVARLGTEAARQRLRELVAAASVAGTDAEQHSRRPWEPEVLDPATIEPPAPPAILRAADEGEGALLYAGMRHLLFGETEALKSWIAAAAAAELARAGRSTLWIDTDGMGKAALVERLGLLGLSDEQIRGHVLYVAPDVPMDEEAAAVVISCLEERDIALVVIDAHDPALELQGLDPNSTADVQRFARVVVDIFHRRGVATLVPDHVARGGDGRDPIASQRKVSGFDVAIRARVDGEPMTRSAPAARVELFGRKDRPGWHDRRGHERRLGAIEFDLRADPPWRLVLGRGDDGERPNRPTVLMERVSKWLEMRDAPASANAIEKAVPGKDRGIRWAIEELVKAGHVATVPGRQRGVVAYVSERPFREADEDNLGPDLGPRISDDLGQPRPGVRPGENAVTKRDLTTSARPRPDLGPDREPDLGPPPSPLREGGAGPKSTDRCRTCGKRAVATEPGEVICRCADDWRSLLPDGDDARARAGDG